MKKSLILAALLVAGVASTFAVEYTAKAKISLGETTITMRESASYSDAFDNGADVSNYNSFGIAVVNEISGMGSNWVQWASAELEGLKIGFKALAAGEQTLTFSGVQGTPLYLVDAVANKTTEITEGGSYVFTADAADVANWNTTRFSITKVLPAKPYTFINNTLVITEATDGAEVTVVPFTYGVNGKALGAPVTYNAPVNQVLNGGYFLVTYTNAEGTDRAFIVNANPDVQPAND